MSKISVVINSLNEAKGLERCLKSIKGWADEIVVVDMESTDNTQEVAKKYGAKVFEHKKINYVEPARNFGISKATNDWILILDPDEEISSELKERLSTLANEGKADYYFLPRKNLILGYWMQHTRWWPDNILRFFRKGKVSWSEVIHAVPVTTGKGLELEALEGNAITHHHYSSVSEIILRMDRYTTVQAELSKENFTNNYGKTILKRFSNEFYSRFFAAEGYKDGLVGLFMSLLQSFSEAVVVMKIWEMNGKKEEETNIINLKGMLDKYQKDLNYWKNDMMVKEKGSLISRIYRKLKI